MSQPLVEPDEPTDEEVAAVFRQVMASATEQARTGDREAEVMEALFPLFFKGVGDDGGEDLGL